MGLFKRNREQDQAQKADHSHSKATSVRRWLGRRLGKRGRQESGNSDAQEEWSENGSANPDLDSCPPSNHEVAPPIQSLWDRAYDTLRLSEDGRKLVEDYEGLLSKEAQNMISTSNDGLAGAVPPDDEQSRQIQLQTIIAAGLQRIAEKKTKYTIAGHEFNLSNQIDQAAKLVIWAKSLIGEAVKQSPEASVAWAGVCIILPLLTNPKIADEANRDGFAYVTTRMQYYTKFEPLVRQLDKNLEVSPELIDQANDHIVQLYERILKFQIRSVLRFYRSHLGRYAGDVILTEDWKKMKSDIKEFEDTVNGTLNQINQFVARQELESLNENSKRSLEVMQQFMSVSEEQVRLATEQLGIATKQLDISQRELEIQENKVKERLSDKQNECLQLFRLTDSNKDATYEWYKDRVETRVEGTCQWFLQHEKFQRWLKQDSGPLLVSADPGCGKSVLAKYLIDSVLPHSPTTTICYFFFKDQDQYTGRQALCAILHQLFSLKPLLIKHAISQFEVNGRGLINSETLLWNVLRNAVQDPQAGQIIIVLDALDECAESEFKDLMRNLQSQFCADHSNPGKLKYLLTSRPYEQIVSKFQHLLERFPDIRIPGEEESDTISREVNRVIEYRVEHLAKAKGLSDKVKGRLAEKLLGIPHRTYLWVYLIFDYLGEENFKKTVNGVDSIISTMPKDISQAYEKILGKCKEETPMVKKALSIILAASRPLTILEMNVALNVDDTSKSIHDLDLEEDKDFILRLRSWCGLFISIHHQKVYFLHQTAREFLLSVPSQIIQSGGCWQHSITNRDAHRVLAEICIIYLDFLNSNDSPTDEGREADRDPGGYPLLDYSANNWNAHFRKACVSNDASIIPSALRICNPDLRSCSTWFKIYWKTYAYRYERPTIFPSSLLIPAHLGNEVIVKLLLEKGADLESKDTAYGRTPLSWAARNGHEGVVKLLLEKGADLESKDNSGRTPLSWVAEWGQEMIAKLLLEKGADLESKDNSGCTPLSWAARSGRGWGRERVAELLLKKGADLESKDNSGRTPLSWAIKEGDENEDEEGDEDEDEEEDEEFVKLLLEKGADPESEDNEGLTPLLRAVKSGHKEVVRLLREKAAERSASLDLKS
ncbi:hypothetical protein F4803DRAFT_364494 [Xylaria telfairii]|nr:hypothetical protein F4803DRAFT_364494 [Xylaria telfairii]